VSFNDVSIAQKIDRFEQTPPDYKKQYPPKLIFLLITVHMGTFIQGCREALKLAPMNTARMINTDVATLRRCILTPPVIKELMKRVQGK
jgi:hypothetical protein